MYNSFLTLIRLLILALKFANRFERYIDWLLPYYDFGYDDSFAPHCQILKKAGWPADN